MILVHQISFEDVLSPMADLLDPVAAHPDIDSEPDVVSVDDDNEGTIHI